MAKSSVEEIRQRFDNEVDRFSNLQTGQSATVDAPLALELISAAAAATNPKAKRVLDIGCGAGNYTLKLLERLPNFNVTLIDLSQPMLDKAQERIRSVSTGNIRAIQGRHARGRARRSSVRHYSGLRHAASPSHRRPVAQHVHKTAPRACAWRLTLDFRPG